MSKKIKGNILLLITALCWGSGFAIRKIGTAAIPPMTFNALILIAVLTNQIDSRIINKLYEK